MSEKIFIFHYGGIKTEMQRMIVVPLKNFIFHYGGIKTVNSENIIKSKITLYSTMVGLKHDYVRWTAVTVIFIFHYGGIKTDDSGNPAVLEYLYIPLWWD